MPDCSGWVIVLGEREGLRWVLQNHRMAWTEASLPRASRIRAGDPVLLYVARGAFHNPTRDESQLLAVGAVTSRVRRFHAPITIGNRQFACGCHLRFDVVLPERQGVPVRPLVEHLSFVKRKDVWGQYFRSGLVSVSARDFLILEQAVRLAGKGGPMLGRQEASQ